MCVLFFLADITGSNTDSISVPGPVTTGVSSVFCGIEPVEGELKNARKVPVSMRMVYFCYQYYHQGTLSLTHPPT